ncbi:protein FAM228B-like isoform X1 [Biomphalaria pfeifferi]|uniref:Protein FAM228B-like isoform X1 n=1 Tax=Biomphalaria pfeifferi TaxID=112525 RepID=A0AAD8BWB1_BIOPF|nr:protein FAM228B-like isoform X1 [Biomphalaria pfeifferi]
MEMSWIPWIKAMQRSFIMLQFIISLCVKDSKTDSLSQFGLQFAFAIPKVNNMDVSVALVTIGRSSFTVTLYTSVPGSTDKLSIETFSVSADVSVDYMLDKGLLSESGRHHCLLLEAELEFAVFVHLSEAENSAASLMLLPIKTWGRRYYLATLSTRAFAVIVAEEETIVKLRFKMEPPSVVTLTLNGAYYTDRSTLKLLLQMYEAFTVSRCDSQYKSEILSLTGSVVESLKPVGVISGSCSSYMRISSRYVQHYMPKEVEICTSYSSPITHDIAAVQFDAKVDEQELGIPKRKTYAEKPPIGKTTVEIPGAPFISPEDFSDKIINTNPFPEYLAQLRQEMEEMKAYYDYQREQQKLFMDEDDFMALQRTHQAFQQPPTQSKLDNDEDITLLA